MLRLPWDRLTAEDFEEFCHQLLGAMGFRDREWHRGPGDRGRDILARRRLQTLAGRERVESWVVECRQQRNTLGVAHIAPSLAWADANPAVDVYLLVTTAKLAVEAREWLQDVAASRRRPYRVEWIDRIALEELARSFPGVVKRFFGATLQDDLSARSDVRSAYFTEMDRLWRSGGSQEDRLRRIQGLFRDHQRRYGDLDDSDYAVLYVSQEHRVRYSVTDTRTEHRLWLANVGDKPVYNDTVTVYGEVPVFDNRELALEVRAVPDERAAAPQAHVTVDTYNVKVLQIGIPGGLPPLGVYGYGVAMSWPFPGPLAGSRYYEMPTYRFTAHLRCQVDVPPGYRVTNATLFEAQNAWTRRVADPSPLPTEDGTRLRCDVYLPRTDSNYRLAFGLVEES